MAPNLLTLTTKSWIRHGGTELAKLGPESVCQGNSFRDKVISVGERKRAVGGELRGRNRAEDAIIAHDLAQGTDRARQTLALLPILRRWVTARVHWAGADADLSLRQYAALSGIRQGATSPGELARLWQVTPAVITGVIDRLERRELVRREPDPDDRRRLRLALTDAGLAASMLVERVLTEELAVQLAKASPHELAELGRALDLLQRTFAALEQQTPRPVEMSAGDDLPAWDDDCSSAVGTSVIGVSNTR